MKKALLDPVRLLNKPHDATKDTCSTLPYVLVNLDQPRLLKSNWLYDLGGKYGIVIFF